MIRKCNFLLLLIVTVLQSCNTHSDKQKIIIFHAGSLGYPFKALTEHYERENPHISIISEAAGSLATARKITELNRKADIIALADYHIIDQLLIPDYTTYNIHFANNSIGLAFTSSSRYHDQINSENWLSILEKPDVKIGASDPDADPCGYRTRMILKLTEKMFQTGDLTEKIFTASKYHQRPKETDLIALLESRTIDYLFLYESVASQHRLKFLAFPDSLNLSNAQLNNWYANAEVTVRGSKEGSRITLSGESITYGISVLKDAPNQEASYDFLRWMLHPEKGIKILQENGLRAVYPPVVTFTNDLPEQIKTIIQP